MIAAGVRLMAAFRGRSLGLLLVFSVDVGGFAGSATGLDIWASVSVTLMLVFSCWLGDVALCWPVIRGGLVLFICGVGPAIDVSGMLVLRGGGGTGSRV